MWVALDLLPLQMEGFGDRGFRTTWMLLSSRTLSCHVGKRFTHLAFKGKTKLEDTKGSQVLLPGNRKRVNGSAAAAGGESVAAGLKEQSHQPQSQVPFSTLRLCRKHGEMLTEAHRPPDFPSSPHTVLGNADNVQNRCIHTLQMLGTDCQETPPSGCTNKFLKMKQT